jgi:threonine/homoserine/homoserine lactone efflux protein
LTHQWLVNNGGHGTMIRLIRIFITGLIISFLGTLPLGTLNISAMQIAVSDGVQPAMYFVMGALLVEIIYVRMSLVAIDWVFRHKRLFRWLEWITVLIIAALAISSFYAAAQPGVHKNVLLSGGIHRFWLGVMMSAVNPVQIPFWFGWSTILFTKKILEHQASHYNTYIAGIGIGTFTGNLVFIFGGRLIVDRLNANEKILQLVIGCIFVITAIIMTWRILNKKEAKTT